MSLPVWPVTVDYQILKQGWSFKPWLPAITSEFDGGNQRARRRPGDNVAIIGFTLIPLDNDSYTALDAFFRDDLANGTARFTMSVWTGAAYETKTVQFDNAEPPAVDDFAVGYRLVSMRLRVFGM